MSLTGVAATPRRSELVRRTLRISVPNRCASTEWVTGWRARFAGKNTFRAVGAIPCHAEGRGFESLQPLLREALHIAGFLRFRGRFRGCLGARRHAGLARPIDPLP